MKLRCFVEKHINLILTLLSVVILLLITALRYDFYYDLNDDVMMKDILAGCYTGVPESHNIQMLYLVSAFISALYRIAGGLPWYGIFLLACQFGCIFIIAYRSLCCLKRISSKTLVALLIVLLSISGFLQHLVFVQYTYTATLLAATGAFWFLTVEKELMVKQFIVKNIPAILLVVIGYLIRSEMVLLVLPFICAAGVIRWSLEESIFSKENWIKYPVVIVGILAGILIGEGTHAIAYSAPEWQKFTEYFNNRTELYDFQVPPDYQENKEFYDSVGLTESEQQLFINYNFGLDDEIDEKLVGELADYAASIKTEKISFGENLRYSLWYYCYRTVHLEDFPYNVFTIMAYFLVLLASVLFTKEKRILQLLWTVLRLGFLFLVRTSLWMYIIMRGRYPSRITHSLYIMELCILAGFLLVSIKNAAPTIVKRVFASLAGGVFLVSALISLKTSLSQADKEYARREELNQIWKNFQTYCSLEENRDNFYFVDVYSTVDYSQKMFENVDNSLQNNDIMGGWACKSPLYEKKLSAFGMTSMEEALISQPGIYIAADETETDLQWLVKYYSDHGKTISLEEVGRITGEQTGQFGDRCIVIWRLKQA